MPAMKLETEQEVAVSLAPSTVLSGCLCLQSAMGPGLHSEASVKFDTTPDKLQESPTFLYSSS